MRSYGAMTVQLTGYALTLDELMRVALGGEQVALAEPARDRIRAARAVVEAALAAGTEVYGLTTGVGVHKRARIDPADYATHNRRLIREHRVGQGEPAPAPVVRAQLLLMANGFARGAGVRLELVERLVTALNDGAAPLVRTLGSLGQADLPANADLAEHVVGDFPLEAKEGHALLANSAFSTALAALAFVDARRLLDSFDVAGALDLEAFAANPSLLDEAVAATRPSPGLGRSVAWLRALLAGSYLWTAAPRSLQDPLSFRCLPQVHGAARDALGFTERQLTVELNAAQENPLLLVEEARFVSAGNFDVLPLAAALDFARIALAPVLTTASERTVKLLQAPLTGLSEGLTAEPGLAESGLSEFAVPVQALAAEAKLLAQPVSIETSSTSHHEGIEDRITLAPLAARRLAQMVELGLGVVAIELVVAAQAIDLRGCPPLGATTGTVYEYVRALVPPLRRGEAPPQDLEPLRALVRGGITPR